MIRGYHSLRGKSVFNNKTKVANEWQVVHVLTERPCAGIWEFWGCWLRSESPGSHCQPGLYTVTAPLTS